VGKLLALVLVVALAGAAVAAYNTFVYELVQPVPLSWNHSEDELRLIALERERRNLAAKVVGNQRVGSLAGVPQIGAPDESEKAALARLDGEIAALRARIESARR
jgi:hypothetical protein